MLEALTSRPWAGGVWEDAASNTRTSLVQSPLRGPFQPPSHHGPTSQHPVPAFAPSGCSSDDPRFLFRMWAPLSATPGGPCGCGCYCVSVDCGGGVCVCAPTQQAPPRR